MPLRFEQLNPISSMPTPSDDVADWILTAFRILMILFWVLLPFYIVYLIISKEARKRFIRDLAMMLPILLLLYFLTNSNLGQQAGQDMEGRFGMNQEENAGEQVEPPTLPEFQPPPAWVTTLTSITVIICVAATTTTTTTTSTSTNNIKPSYRSFIRRYHIRTTM